MDFLSYLAKEGAVIWQAPVTFLIAVVLAGLAAYGLARWAYTVRLEALAERIKLKDDQNSDLKGRLAEVREAVASPLPPSRDADANDHSAVLRQLTQLYVFDHGATSREMLIGAELPPEHWLNKQLEHKGVAWRVRNVKGGRAEIYEPTPER